VLRRRCVEKGRGTVDISLITMSMDFLRPHNHCSLDPKSREFTLAGTYENFEQFL